MEITTVGLDLAKSIFQIHAIDEAGKTLIGKALRRAQVLPFFAKLPPCLIGMEACGTSHHWARGADLAHGRSLPASIAGGWYDLADPARMISAGLCRSTSARDASPKASTGGYRGCRKPDGAGRLGDHDAWRHLPRTTGRCRITTTKETSFTRL